MSEFETKDYKPNDRELRLFEQEKLDLYKGTFVVCIVYGLSAFLLLVIILFTEWGKELIYDKFAPAVITYILGSLIIIIYLLNAIFSIRPRKIGNDLDSDMNITCPDYWKLERIIDPEHKKAIIRNNGVDSENKEGNIIPSINMDANANLQYRCKYDDNVYGNTKQFLKMKNDIGDEIYLPGFEKLDKANGYIVGKSQYNPDYIVKEPKSTTTTNKATYDDLKKYAKLTGVYGHKKGTTVYYDCNNKINDSNDTYTLKIKGTGYNVGVGNDTLNTVTDKYVGKTPLICNVVYPQVLGLLDTNTKDKNEVSCEYAKQCGVSWSSLKCK
jgi:hypothetical protein